MTAENEPIGFVVAEPVEVIQTTGCTEVVHKLTTLTKRLEDADGLAQAAAESLSQIMGAESYRGPISMSECKGKFYGFSDWGGSTWRPKGDLNKPYVSSGEDQTPPPSASKPKLN